MNVQAHTTDRKIRYGMVMDTRKCVGCNACVLACKNENGTPDGFTRDWITTATRGRFPELSMEIRSERCNHCEDAPCVTVCPTGASHITDTGIVLVDHDKCTGCKACIAACPYDARFINPVGYADKCTFCNHRVEKGQDPACVMVCPTESLHFGDLNDPDSKVSRLLAENANKVLLPEAGTRPKLFFLV